MVNFDSFLPSDEWHKPKVHWHAYLGRREPGSQARVGDRVARRERAPDAVLRSPFAVASWIDKQTRSHVLRREVFAMREGMWVSIGDEDDLEHLRQENFLIASRGDSVFTDIYSESQHIDLYVEAVTDEQCTHGCASGGTE